MIWLLMTIAGTGAFVFLIGAGAFAFKAAIVAWKLLWPLMALGLFLCGYLILASALQAQKP